MAYTFTGSNSTGNLSFSVRQNDRNTEDLRLERPRVQKNGVFFSVLCDQAGCGHYRSKFITQELSQIQQSSAFVEEQLLPSNENELKHCTSIRLQRLHTPGQTEWFTKVLLPLRDRHHFRILYDLDDILIPDVMPACNLCRNLFSHAEQTLPVFFEHSDVVTVSTTQLRDFYSERFHLPADRFLVVPNYTPQYWADHYHPAIVEDKLRRHEGKPLRIGFSSTPFHFDIDGRSGGKDDMSGLTEWIIENRKKYRFVFQGGISCNLLPYKEDFEIYPYAPFLHFLQLRQKMDLDLLIQPLENNLFNRAKSVIKLYEAWATGLPVFTQDLPNYREASAESCFHDVTDLIPKIQELFSSPEHYAETVFQNHQKMESLWLHKHVDQWLDLMVYH